MNTQIDRYIQMQLLPLYRTEDQFQYDYRFLLVQDFIAIILDSAQM